MKCFHCGGPHRVVDCPQKGRAQQAQTVDEAAKVVFFAESVDTEMAYHASVQNGKDRESNGNDIVSGSVLEQRYGVIDSGATASLGSVEALEAVMYKNLEERGQCGVEEVHVHNSPGQPILISRRALRALGAVIDFETNECIFKSVDSHKVVILKEAAHGWRSS